MIEVLKNLSKNQLITVAASAVIGFAIIILSVINFSSTDMVPLYIGLGEDDMSEVLYFLDMNGEGYKLEDNKVMVGAHGVRGLRMRLAAEGIPRSGSIVGYEIFNKNESMSSSSFNQNVNLLRALEGELARSIMTFENIKSARVHLVLPKREVFVKDRSDATASVVLKVRAGIELPRKAIEAISNLVLTAVPGLKLSNLTIVTTNGKPLKVVNDEEGIISTANDYKFNLERRMRDTIENLIERYVGVGAVRAEVYADINFDKETVNIERYDPAGKVLRSEHATEEKSSSNNTNGTVSVGNDIPNSGIAGGDSAAGANSQANRVDEIRNYEISKEIRNSIKASGMIKKLSIAVLVDGIYKKNDDTDVEEYVPRNDDELQKLKSLVSSAIGFDETRGDVVEIINMQFSKLKVDEPTWFENIIDDFAIILNSLIKYLVILLVALLVVKPLFFRVLDIVNPSVSTDSEGSSSAKDMESQENAIEEGHDSEIGAILNENIDNPIIPDGNIATQHSTLDKLNNFVTEHPDEVLSIIRHWLYKGGNHRVR